MDKKLSKLELVKMEIEVAERKTNQKIKELSDWDQIGSSEGSSAKSRGSVHDKTGGPE